VIGAFQPKGFQGNAFQVAPVEGYILATDGDDSATINGLVSTPAGYIDTTDTNDTANFVGTVEGEQPTIDTHDGFTAEEIRRARNLDRKIREKQLALYKAQEEAKKRRKQQLKDAIDPPKVIAKVKKNKLQSIQEVKADIPSVDTTELEQSIAYLENQRSKLSRAVELRKQQAYISAQLAILEAQRLAEQDDEVSVLLLM
jgi:hypothetical protein